MDTIKTILKEIWYFLSSKLFLKNFGILVTVGLIGIFCLRMWLGFYTNHGEKVEVVDLRNTHLEEAKEAMNRSKLKLVVSDSFFRVGSEGGVILEQNPLPGSFVKENRSIYVKISKFTPDQVRLEDLPLMYGQEYNNVSRVLSTRFDISSKIIKRKYDSGPPDHILAVYYKGDEVANRYSKRKGVRIDRGGKLEFIVSQSNRLAMQIPNLECKSVSEARLLLSSHKLKLSGIEAKGAIKDTSSAYVVSQFPAFGKGKTLYNGD